jgi:hypothetical protein
MNDEILAKIEEIAKNLKTTEEEYIAELRGIKLKLAEVANILLKNVKEEMVRK